MKKLLFTILTLLAALSSFAQFAASNIAVLEAASATANNTTGSIIELNKTSALQTAVNTYVINGTTGTDALRFSGSATSTMYLANSSDRSLLCFSGGNTTTTTGNMNTILTRGVGAYNPAGMFSLAATYTGISGNQARCATTINNTDYFIADQGGLYTNNATAVSPAGNFRAVKSFGGISYIAASSSTVTTIQVSTISAVTGGTITGLAGLTNDATIQDFYLIRSGSNGASYDVMYIVYATSNTAGTIAKYSLVGGIWTPNGTYTTTFGGFGLAAEVSSTGANLYVSTGQGALAANSVVKLNDAAGYNTTINITTANNITLYTAGAGAVVKGVAFAPANIATPSLTVTPSATIGNTFITAVSTASASDSITVAGSNLTSSVTITAPASFQVATTLGGSYSSSVILTAATGTLSATKVYVRFLPAATGTVTGAVVASATGAVAQNVTVNGATPGPVVLTSVSSVANTFITLVNVASASDSFSISGSNLTANVTVTAPASFEVATSLTGTYGTSATCTPTTGTLANTKVYVRFKPTAVGPANGIITVASTGATTQNVAVTGNTPTPVITATAGAISNTFITVVGGVSVADTFSVAGTALNASLSVTAPANFEIATTLAGPYASSLALTPTVGAVSATTIYVRFHPLSAGVISDTVKLTSTGAVSRYVLVNGFTGNASNPQAFDLSAGNYLMSQWDSSSAALTYPQNMIFHTTNLSAPTLTTSQLVNNWGCAYNLASRPRLRGLAADGFSMINTGNAQYDNCSSGSILMSTFMGAALLAVNTTSVTNITLKYNVGLVKQGDGATVRVYNLRLQYRLDSVSAYADMLPLSEYSSAGKVDGDLQTITIALPAQFENKPYVEFRWLYYADTSVTGASGTRPELRLDEISVAKNNAGVGQVAGGNNSLQVYPNPVLNGGTIHFPKTLSGKLYNALGQAVAGFVNAISLEVKNIAPGIYTIVTEDGAHSRLVVQ